MDSVHQAVQALGAIERPDVGAIARLASRHRRLRLAQGVACAVVAAGMVLSSAVILGNARSGGSRSVEAAAVEDAQAVSPHLDSGLVVHRVPDGYVLVLDQRMNDPSSGSFSRQQSFTVGGLPLNHPDVATLVVYAEQRQSRIAREVEWTAPANVPNGFVEVRGGGTVVEFQLSATMTVGATSNDVSTQDLIATLESTEVDVPDCIGSPSEDGCGDADSTFAPSDGAVDHRFGPVTVTTRPAVDHPR